MQLERNRYFEISECLDAGTAPSIWGRANTVLQDGLTACEILRKFRVRLVCTTADPIDDLSAHGAIAKANAAVGERLESFGVLPTFRPDKALRIDMPQTFSLWLQKLREASNIVDLRGLTTFLDALRNRHDYFRRARLPFLRPWTRTLLRRDLR